MFWKFWLPGVRVANDYHLPQYTPTAEQILPWIWRETNVADGLGEYNGATLWSQSMQSFFSIFQALSVPPSLQTKFLGSLVLIVGIFSLSKLLGYLGIKGFGRYLGVLFYLTNSYFLLLFDGGQLSLAFAYAASPYAVYLFLKMLKDFTFTNKLFLTLSLLLISVLDIRFIYLLALILSFSTFFQLLDEPASKRLRLIKQLFLFAPFLITIFIGFHFYWILPSILTKQPYLPQTYERTSQVNFLSFSSVGHSLLLQQPHWYKNIFGQVSNLRAEFIFIPILVFLAPLLRRRDKVVGFWLLIAALGIFLSKGSQEPFGQIYPWLFTHIPGFSLFRDPSKFYLFISLSYSILIAITIQEITSGKNKFIPYLVLIYLVWLMRPIYLNQMTGLLSPPVFEPEYSKMADYFKQDNNYSRIFWIPTKAPLGMASNIHPPVEASRFAQKRTFAVGTKGSYETFNFLREVQYMGQLFDVAGIGYVAYPYLDKRRADMHRDNIRYYYSFLDQLSKLPWLSQVDNLAIPLLKTDHHQDKFFVAANVWYVLGSDNVYNEATKSALLQLSKNALVFVEEYPGLGKRIDELPEAKIILNNKTSLDLAASFVNPLDLIFPAKKLNFEPDSSGWWKREASDLIRWRDFLQTKYALDNQDFDLGGGWAVGEGNLELKVRSEKFGKDKVLLARVLESTRSGQLKFYQESNLIGQISTNNDGNNIRWFEVGILLSDGRLTIHSEGDINVVNALAVLDKIEWSGYKNKANKLQKEIVEFNEENVLTTTAKVSYKEINPTKYQVTISNLKEPAFLVFSQNYDALWRVKDKKALPVYSLLNGFMVDQDGEYLVEFEAQKYVYLGFLMSLATLLTVVILLVSKSRKGKLRI